MKFSNIAALALSAQAVYATNGKLYKRQATVIQGVLDGISSQLNTVSDAVNAYTGSPEPLTGASAKLLDLIRSGTTTVEGSADLDQNGALQISTFVQDLSTRTDNVVNGLISKKSDLCSNGQGGTVLQNLQDQRTESGKLAKAITSKVPTALQPVANQLSGSIDTALGRGVDAFSSDCASSGGGGSTPPSSSGGSAPTGGSSSSPSSPSSGPSVTRPSVIAPTAPTMSRTSAPAQQTTNAASANRIAAGVLGVAGLALLI